MAVSVQNTNFLESTLTIYLPVEEYQPKLNEELQKHRNKAQLKGFRKGKTSLDLIKNMYGNAILHEVVEHALQAQLTEYLQTNKINLLGQPIANPGQVENYYNIHDLRNFTFLFDLGQAPDFELIGLDQNYDFTKIIVDEEMVSEQMTALQKRHADMESIDGPITKDHLINIDLNSIGIAESEENHTRSTSLWLSQISEDALPQFVGKIKGDVFESDIRTWHTDKDEAFLRERYLKESGADIVIPALYQIKITDIRQTGLADLNQEFYDKAFGEGRISTEEEAKNLMKESIEDRFLRQSEALLFRDLQDKLIKDNDQQFPDIFLKRWLKTQNEKLNDETIDKEYGEFKLNLMWTLIRDKIINKFDIKISRDEVRNAFRGRILNYFGGIPMGDTSFLEPTIQKMMQNEEQVHQISEEILSDKVFEAISSVIVKNDKLVPKQEFEAIMDAAREESKRRKELASKHNHDHDHDHGHDHGHHDHGDHAHKH